MGVNRFSMQTTCTGPYTVRVMDGQAVRDFSLDWQEFGLYGIWNDFKDIPKNEIWISERLPIGEYSFLMAGAMTRLRCLEQGMDEGKAYDRGVAKEKAERAKHDVRSDKKERPSGDHVGKPQVIIDDTGYAHIVGDGSETPVHVYLVDADLVRDSFKTDFLEGGNGAVYGWVPKDQIWLESDLSDTEIPYVALHEYVERLLMLRRGLDYDTAHDLASKVEFAHRSDGPMLQTDVMALTPAILDEVPDGKDKEHDRNPTPPSVSTEKALDLGSEQSQIERAKQADLIEFPPDVDGTRCSNCQFIDSGYCYHSKVDQIINKPETMCCRFWDSPGTKREWEQPESKAMSAFNELSGGALVAPPEYKLPLLPLERNRGQRSLLSDPEGLKRLRQLRTKYKSTAQLKPPEAKPTRMGTGSDEHIVSHGEKKPEPKQQESKPASQHPVQIGTKQELSANIESQQEGEVEVRDKLIEKERKQTEKRAKRQRQEEDKDRKQKHTKEEQSIESDYERQRTKYAKNRSREEDSIVGKMSDEEMNTVWINLKTQRDAEDTEFYKKIDDQELNDLKELWKKQEQENKQTDDARKKEDDETHSKWDDEDYERTGKDAQELHEKVSQLQPAPKQEQKSGTWKTVRGCRVFVENGKIIKGPPALVNLNQKDITPQWVKAEDEYRGIRSLKTLRQKYRRKM